MRFDPTPYTVTFNHESWAAHYLTTPLGYVVVSMLLFMGFSPAYNEYRAARPWLSWLLLGIVTGPLAGLVYLLVLTLHRPRTP